MPILWFFTNNIGSALVILTIILIRIIPASTETAILEAHYPLTLPSASFVDPSILRRKRLEANAASVRQQLQHQRDVQVENVGGLLGPLPSINTGNDATGRQPINNNLQSVLGEQQTQQQSIVAPIHSSVPSILSQQQQPQEVYPPSSTPPANYQIEQQQSTEIYARLGQQQQQATISATEEDYQTIATPVAPLSPDNAATPSGYENHETPPPPQLSAHRYYYPPRIPLPLPTCFHNPTGYPCCNPKLNDLIVETYTMLESKPRFHTCNINAIAQHLQIRAETRFNMSFETVAAFDDFAQKIHFAGDLVCKVELGGKYMLAYATVKDVSRVLSVEPGEQQNEGGAEGSAASNNISGKRRKRQVYGPELPKPLNDLTRHYSMWI